MQTTEPSVVSSGVREKKEAGGLTHEFLPLQPVK